MGEITAAKTFLIPFDDFTLVDDTEDAWLIEGMLPKGGLTLLYARPGAYKTFIALGMARAVLAGRPFCDFPVRNSGAVVYIALEGKRGIKARVEALRETLSEDQRKKFRGVDYPFRLPDTSVVQWSSFVSQLMAFKKLVGPIRLIVIDTLARLSEAEENNSTQIGRVINDLQSLIDALGATVLLVHHEGKSAGKGLRGSSALEGAADTVLHVEKVGGPLATLSCEKQKDFDQFGEFIVELEAVTLPNGTSTLRVKGRANPAEVILHRSSDENSPGKPKSDAAKKAILDLLSRGNALQNKDLKASVAEVGVKSRTFQLALKELEAEGRIAKADDGRWVMRGG